MKHIKKLNEIASKYDQEKHQYIFDPADIEGDNTITFYLHAPGKQGFVLEVLPEDQKELEAIFTKNKIDYTVSTIRNILPF